MTHLNTNLAPLEPTYFYPSAVANIRSIETFNEHLRLINNRNTTLALLTKKPDLMLDFRRKLSLLTGSTPSNAKNLSTPAVPRILPLLGFQNQQTSSKFSQPIPPNRYFTSSHGSCTSPNNTLALSQLVTERQQSLIW